MRTEINQKMTETADYIFRHPEISLKEEKSSQELARFLEERGWGRRSERKNAPPEVRDMAADTICLEPHAPAQRAR